MKQVLQDLKGGQTEVAEVPAPRVRPGTLLIAAHRSLVSVGTERMLVEFGRAGWLAKARQQPDKVRMVLDKVRTDGIGPTLNAVRSKLEQPLPLGYCHAGRVIAVGEGVNGFVPGDRVVSNGHHAEIVCVPVNLCAKVPDAVDDDTASFTVLGAIALQGIRLVQPTLGETVVVTGLGLVGLLTVQLLRANGCRVLGIDHDARRLALARQMGAAVVDLGRGDDPVAAALSFSRGRGVDAVLITASTDSNEPVHQAATMCRKRGRIVLVGVAGLSLSRADFFEKELTFQVSCSYGPGRYDAAYEEQGQDYPAGFVRWTEQRNFEAVLDMMAEGRLSVEPLVSHRFAIDEAAQAYALVAGQQPSLGILLDYPAADAVDVGETASVSPHRAAAPRGPEPSATAAVRVGFVGAGNYATAILMPAFRRTDAELAVVASAGGVRGVHARRKFGFGDVATDAASVIGHPTVNTVVIATRHDSHARFALDALAAGRHVFVEKPLALNHEELDALAAAAAAASTLLMVGFNRRFAPHVQRMKAMLDGIDAPRRMVMTVNAGQLPADHWTLDPRVGGGRIIGEACHFVDLLRHLAGAPLTAWQRHGRGTAGDDSATLLLDFADGSSGVVHYLANGSRRFPKERLEVFCNGRVLQLDNFRRLHAHGWPGFRRRDPWRQDKGQAACVAAFVDAVAQGGASPIPLEELIEVSRVVIDLAHEPA